jgi:hypothetical protein
MKQVSEGSKEGNKGVWRGSGEGLERVRRGSAGARVRDKDQVCMSVCMRERKRERESGEARDCRCL